MYLFVTGRKRLHYNCLKPFFRVRIFPVLLKEWVSSWCRYTGESLSEQTGTLRRGFCWRDLLTRNSQISIRMCFVP
jgi:hypothetical protein